MGAKGWIVAASVAIAIAGAALIGAHAQTAQPEKRTERIVWPTLERFDSETEFLAYLREVRHRLRRQRGALPGAQYAQADDPCPPELAPCPPVENDAPPPPPPPPPPSSSAAESIVVTGSRAADASVSAPANPAITNTQKVGVDEGDIVKQIGQYLIVLQDGRLFVADTRPGGAPGLAFVDRANVYRAPVYTWYDEMLVFGNRIVVTAYSYQHGATEFSVFSLSDAGKLTREGAYYLSSHDYYSAENYATRLVDDKLIIYSPLYIAHMNSDAPIRWPLVRRWVSEDAAGGRLSNGARLFNATDIYRPIQETLQPVVHTVSVCPLGGVGAGDELACTASAFVGPPQRELYVSRDYAYLWVASDQGGASDCSTAGLAEFEHAPEAALFRLPHAGGQPEAMFVRGAPRNQFGLDTSNTAFRALLVWNAPRCGARNLTVRYFDAPLSAFSARPQTMAQRRFVQMPPPGQGMYENRFTDTHLVYGARAGYGSSPPNTGAAPMSARVVIARVDRPRNAQVLIAPHSIIRLERAGNNMVATGYRTSDGLSVSLFDLRRTPRLASTALLQGRYESEGRSHAFNSAIGADGGGILGLPTVLREENADRRVYWSNISDVSFLTVSARGALAPAGSLDADREDAVHPSYTCEVSCVDWYGNARPIFTDGRIFALSNGELIEGALEAGQMRERRRLNLTAPPD
ncbi:MAG: hypothetical protein GC206_10155 [Alphaproteobacteria bacterium]|nr:hypothetical protein [Alphaproteobacteria bacterium]